MRVTGARFEETPPRGLVAREEWADEVYETLRGEPDLGVRIAAKNPTINLEAVEQVLQHLLHEKHSIMDYGGEVSLRRYDAGVEEAQALLRLRQGAATDTDLLLLRHELAESQYYRDHPGSVYQEAHAAANRIADWWSQVSRKEGG